MAEFQGAEMNHVLEGFKIRSFGRDYYVDQGGLKRLDGGRVSPDFPQILNFYISSESTALPSFNFVRFHQLDSSAIGRQNFERRRLVEPFIDKFGDNLPLLQKTVEALGGAIEGPAENGEHLWTFFAFPKLPLRLNYFEADNEFPAEVRFLFDADSFKIINMTCLGLAGFFIDTLLETANDIELDLG